MESIKNTLQKTNLEKLQKTSQPIKTSNEISIYRSGVLTQKTLIEATEKILVAFPKIEPQMLKLLKERFKANNFDDERVIDAVNYVIDNYSGWDKLPSIADFINYDKKIRIYTAHELMEQYKDYYHTGATYDPIANEYIAVDINSELRYIKKDDYEKYKKNFIKWERRKNGRNN